MIIRRLAILWLLIFGLSLSTACFFPAVGKSGGQGAQPQTGGQASAPRSPGAFTILGADPPTLDPHLTQDSTSAEYIVEIFSGLVTLDDKLQVVPDLAESWKVSPDGLTYVFTLRQGAKFHSGKDVTADDFKYSLERATDPRTQSVVADTYLGDIVGAKEKLDGKNKQMSGVKVVDPRTLQITIDAPKAYFLAKLTYPTAFVVDEENVTKGGRNWTDKPNGTGPFKLAEWKKGERIVLQRNPSYYNGVAKVDQVVYNLAGGSPMTMYENGEIDVTGVPLTELDRVQDPSNPLNKELRVEPSLSVWYIGFNVTRPPFDDPKVRQAFNLAVDKDLILKQVLKDAVIKADGPIPPGMPGYNEKLRGLGFNPEQAKQLIAQSKYGDVKKFPPLVLSVQGTGGSTTQSATAIIAMWKQNLGVDVQVEQVEWATYLDDLKKKQFQMYEVGWIADYPDPQDFVDALFHSKSLDNNMGYANPEVDRLVEAARTERDPQKRLALYQQAEQIVVDDASWLPLWFPKSYVLVKPYVEGYIVPPMVIPILKYVSLKK